MRRHAKHWQGLSAYVNCKWSLLWCCASCSLPVGLFIRGLDLILVGREARQKMAQDCDEHRKESWSVVLVDVFTLADIVCPLG